MKKATSWSAAGRREHGDAFADDFLACVPKQVLRRRGSN